MELLRGKPVADQILAHIESEIALNTAKPGLAVLLVGNDEASKIYVSLKEKKAREIGMNFFRFDLSKDISQDEILQRIEKLNKDILVHGIIVQLPLPPGFDTEKIISAIDPAKDADGFSNQDGSTSGGKSELVPVFPNAIMKLIESSKQEISGKKAVVVTNSDIFGQTMSRMLQERGLSTEYVFASDILSNLEKVKGADVVVSAVGSPGLLKGEMFKDGSIIIDGGIEKVDGRILGDVNFASTEPKSGFITPVPGGVGPLTIACLLENTFLAFKAQQR